MFRNEIFKKIFRPQWLLIYILVFAFIARIIGIQYGLPLWLIHDETSPIMTAFKMIQLKTLLPIFHSEEFQPFSQYPPYLSYIYLLPFSILLAIKYFFFNGGFDQFLYYVTSDLSSFFIVARFLSIIFGVASVGLLYKITKNIFHNIYIALLAAFLLGTSLLHILLSVTGRPWLLAAFLFILGLYFLTNEKLSFQKKFLYAMIVAGIGTGVIATVVLLVVLIFYWCLFYEKKSINFLLHEKNFYLTCFIFIILIMLPIMAHHGTNDFRGDVTVGNIKMISGVLQSPFLLLRPVALSEPILILFAIIGLILSFLYKRRLFWPIFLFIYTYSIIFYLFFRYEHRFTTLLLPLLVILAAYGFCECYRRISNRMVAIMMMTILIIPIFLSLRLSYLIYNNDSRVHARQWVEENLPAGSKILVYALLTRLSSTAAAIQEQELLDPNSLRKVDLAEANLDNNREGKFFHALNLYDVNNQKFYDNLEEYARDNSYQYIFFGGTNPREFDRLRDFQEVADQGKLLKSFGEFQEIYSPSLSQLLGNPFYLFKLKEFGPPIAIYKLY